MASVPIRVNTKDYIIACDDGQEEHLRALAFDLDERIHQLTYQMGGSPGEVMALLLASLMLSDEVAENKKEIERLSREVRQLTQHLSQTRGAGESPRAPDLEHVMLDTLGEIAGRIEKMAAQIELR